MCERRIIKGGEGDCPNRLCRASINYSVRVSGTDVVCDSCEGYEFTIGAGEVVKGLDSTIGSMKRGERSVITIPPEMAWGSKGNPPAIPPNATLDYDVELLNFTRAMNLEEDGTEYYLNVHDKITLATEKKDAGNIAFKKGDIEGALELYRKAAAVFQQVEFFEGEAKIQAQPVLAVCNLNAAACLLKKGSPQDLEEAVELCSSVIKENPKNVKALFRRSQGNRRLRNLDTAKEDLLVALEVDPSDSALRAEMKLLNDALQKELDKQKKSFAAMFQADSNPAAYTSLS